MVGRVRLSDACQYRSWIGIHANVRLLIATDHRYFHDPIREGIWDNYCFDRRFFDDYLSVFESVEVAARVRKGPLPTGSHQSDGAGVSFVPIRDVRGLLWIAAPPGSLSGPLIKACRNADAVCLRIPSVLGVHAYFAARLLRKPVMFELIGDPEASLGRTEHGLAAALYGKLQAWITRRICRTADCGSYVSRNHLQVRYPSNPSAHVESISSIRLRPDDIQSVDTHDTVPNPLRLVQVGSLVPVKCHETTIRAIAMVNRDGLNVHLTIVGDGPRRASLETLVTELGIRDSVVFVGHAAGPERVRGHLDDSDVFVLSSSSEGMPRAMIEAMAMGLPALGSAVGGINELLPDEQLFPVHDFTSLAKLIASVAKNPSLLNQFALHSQKVCKDFGEEELSARRIRLYRALQTAVEKRRDPRGDG